MPRGYWFPRVRPEDFVPPAARKGDAWLTYLDRARASAETAAKLFEERVKTEYDAGGSWHVAEEKATKSANAALTRECKAVAVELGLV